MSLIRVASCIAMLAGVLPAAADAASLRELKSRLPRGQRIATGKSGVVAIEVRPHLVHVEQKLTSLRPGAYDYHMGTPPERPRASGMPVALVYDPGKLAALLYDDGARGVRAVEHRVRSWSTAGQLRRRLKVRPETAREIKRHVELMEHDLLARGDTPPALLVPTDPAVVLEYGQYVTKVAADSPLNFRFNPEATRPTTVTVSGLGPGGRLSVIGLLPHSGHIWKPYCKQTEYLTATQHLVIPEQPGETMLKGVEQALGFVGNTTFKIQLRDPRGQLSLDKTVKGDELVTLSPLELQLEPGDNRLTIGPEYASASQFSAGRTFILRWRGK